MSALDVLLAGRAYASEAGQLAELLAALATIRAPEQVSLWVYAAGGTVQLRVRSTAPTRSFAESEPGAYVRDLLALDAVADRWGHACRSTGRSLWWAQLGTAARIGGER